MLVHRQGIHVAAQQHRGAGLRALQRGHCPGNAGAQPPFQRQIGQLGLHLGQGERGFQPQFRLGMDRAAKGGDARGNIPGGGQQVMGQHGAMCIAPG